MREEARSQLYEPQPVTKFLRAGKLKPAISHSAIAHIYSQGDRIFKPEKFYEYYNRRTDNRRTDCRKTDS
ncbi:hypothetical protein NSTCB13_00751 [Nostoc sp. DSM 114160]